MEQQAGFVPRFRLFPFRTAYRFDGVLLVAEKLDISWFNLKNYEAFKTMSLEAWAQQLAVRRSCYLTELDRPENSDYACGADFDEQEEYLLSIATDLKSGVIASVPTYHANSRDKKVKAILDRYIFSTASVDSLSSSDLLRMAKDERLSPVWNACVNTWDIFSDENLNGNYQEIAEAPHDFNILEYSHCAYGESRAHVVINLFASDDQIKKDFNHWLTNYKKELNNYRKKHDLGTKEC